MADLKAAVHSFLNNVDFSKDRVAIVTFNDTAVINNSLTTNKAALDTTVDAMIPLGLTNYEDALIKARTEINAHRRAEANPVVIMLTDGRQTVGGDPLPIAADIKASGTQIFVMGLGIVGFSDIAQLQTIASDPDSTYYRSVATSA
jgi:Ca-activated chloride channel homolog